MVAVSLILAATVEEPLISALLLVISSRALWSLVVEVVVVDAMLVEGKLDIPTLVVVQMDVLGFLVAMELKNLMVEITTVVTASAPSPTRVHSAKVDIPVLSTATMLVQAEEATMVAEEVLMEEEAVALDTVSMRWSGLVMEAILTLALLLFSTLSFPNLIFSSHILEIIKSMKCHQG